MSSSEAFVAELLTRTELAMKQARGKAEQEARVLTDAMDELMKKLPDAKGPHIFVSEGWGKVEPLFERLKPTDEEYDRWCDVLSDSWNP